RALERAVSTGRDRRARVAHQRAVGEEVVHAEEAEHEHLAREEEMAQVRAGESARAAKARAPLVDGRSVLAKPRLLDVQLAEARERLTIAGVARGEHAIEHVDAVLDALE